MDLNEWQERIARKRGCERLDRDVAGRLWDADAIPWQYVPDWPRDISAAMELLDEIEAHEDTVEVHLGCWVGKNKRHYRVRVYRYGRETIHGDEFDTRQQAICDAWEKWCSA